SDVVETNVVDIGVPSTVTTDVLRKLAPFSVNVTGTPATPDAGAKPVTAGTGLRMLKVNVVLPPPGGGFVMTPVNVPAFWIRSAVRLNRMVSPETLPETPARLACVTLVKP